ncbi:hypothetical protein [Paraburkholderia xenovorans]|uniref:hypothetical protein n=1 Tax=Paraburkholderia xenovorans TaxID=36873 RepID=UPI0038BC8070
MKKLQARADALAMKKTADQLLMEHKSVSEQFRFDGGEEFVVLLVACGHDGARRPERS